MVAAVVGALVVDVRPEDSSSSSPSFLIRRPVEVQFAPVRFVGHDTAPKELLPASQKTSTRNDAPDGPNTHVTLNQRKLKYLLPDRGTIVVLKAGM